MYAQIILLMLFAQRAFSFSWEECRHGFAMHFGEVGFFISTSQFSSSTGGCSLVGTLSKDPKIFVERNAYDLRIDIARGEGEYISNLAKLAKCDEIKFKAILKRNYTLIFTSDDLEPSEILKNMSDVILENNRNGDLCEIWTS